MTTPIPVADAAAPGTAAEAITMPIAGVPDSQVYVYPMTADPRASIEAAREQLRTFAAMFHAADPGTYRDFVEQWGRLEEKRAPSAAVRLSNSPAPSRSGAGER
jgi:hypothetical protein